MHTCVQMYVLLYECMYMYVHIYICDPVRLMLRHLYQIEFCSFIARYLTAGASMYCGHISSSDFSQKTGFDISCKLSPMMMVCMKCQILFSCKSKKNISKCYLLNFLPSMQNVNTASWSYWGLLSACMNVIPQLNNLNNLYQFYLY